MIKNNEHKEFYGKIFNEIHIRMMGYLITQNMLQYIDYHLPYSQDQLMKEQLSGGKAITKIIINQNGCYVELFVYKAVQKRIGTYKLFPFSPVKLKQIVDFSHHLQMITNQYIEEVYETGSPLALDSE